MNIKMLSSQNGRLYQITLTHWEARVLVACLRWVPLSKVMRALSSPFNNAAKTVSMIYAALTTRVDAETERLAREDSLSEIRAGGTD